MQTMGKGNWVRYENEPGVPGTVYLRLKGDGEGFCEMYVSLEERPLKAADLRRLPLARLLAMCIGRVDFRYMLDQMPELEAPDVKAALDKAFPIGRKGRPKVDTKATLSKPTDGLTPEFLQQVAAAYRAAVHRGERPLKALAEQVGNGDGAPYRRIVERWVYLARKSGHLEPTSPGSISKTGGRRG